MAKQSKTSWESSAKWYDVAVGQEGHYYHEHVIFPNLLKLMNLEKKSTVLDLGCGQGILSRKLPPSIPYVGIDLSPSLIQSAKKMNRNKEASFEVHDITQPFILSKNDFTHCCIILALQNLGDPLNALENVARHLQKGGHLFLVLNHPCFRIPRMSHWGEDEGKQILYRRMDGYLSEQKIPIQTHPSKGKSSTQTWSFHHPLSTYSKWVKEAGFAIVEIQEWTSDKQSTGKKAKMENRARREFPLFLTLICQLNSSQ
jgi:ubiquinone/menaquinone biosynthesis C-methylase UbiE